MVETQNCSELPLSITKQKVLERVKEICDKIIKSYGAMSETLKFLDPIEQLKMQALSLWWYNIAVSRVQTSCKLEKRVHYLHDTKGSIVALEEVKVSSLEEGGE